MVEPVPPQPRGPESRPGAWVVGETVGTRSELLSRLDFDKGSLEWRRLFSELFGTFLLVVVAAGAGMVNARFGGHAVPTAAQVVAPGLMVMSVILFMGAVSGAHLNPGVTIAFALRRDFRWRRVPGYIVAQFAGAILATILLRAILGHQGAAGLTLPGPGVSSTTVFLWEMVLSMGLGQRHPGHGVRRPGGGLGRCHRGGRLYRSGRSLWLAGERRLHEHRALAWTGSDRRGLHRLVGVPRRPPSGKLRGRGHRLRPPRRRRRHDGEASWFRHFGRALAPGAIGATGSRTRDRPSAGHRSRRRPLTGREHAEKPEVFGRARCGLGLRDLCLETVRPRSAQIARRGRLTVTLGPAASYSQAGRSASDAAT